MNTNLRSETIGLFVCLSILVALMLSIVPRSRRHLVIISGQSNAVRLDEELVGQLVGDCVVSKSAWGATPISMWLDGPFFASMVSDARAACQDPERVTLVWIQGERDARDQNQNYAEDLRDLIVRTRAEWPTARHMTVIARLSDYGANNPDWQSIRAAQEEIAAEDYSVRLVNTDDLNGRGNDIHFTAQGYVVLAQRIAEATE